MGGQYKTGCWGNKKQTGQFHVAEERTGSGSVPKTQYVELGDETSDC